MSRSLEARSLRDKCVKLGSTAQTHTIRLSETESLQNHLMSQSSSGKQIIWHDAQE